MTKRTILAVFATVTSLSSAASAQSLDGFYLKAYGGFANLQGDMFSLDGTASTLSYEGGTIFGGAIGYQYEDRPIRAELEFTYRSDEVEDLPVAVASGGDFASTTVMLNGYYVFDRGTKLTPYVGFGLGYVTEVDFDLQTPSGEVEYSDRGSLAYQVVAGADYAFSERLSAFAELRYFSAGTAEMTSEAGERLSSDYDSLDVLVGAKFNF